MEANCAQVAYAHKHLNKLRQDPSKLIENRIGFAGRDSIFSIYDTYANCKDVELTSEGITLCGMLSGKKVIHTQDQSIDFLPGQSFAISNKQQIKIDFPDAKLTTPTTCITISLTPERILQVCEQLNLNHKKSHGEWHYNNHQNLHLNLSNQTQSLLERLAFLYVENDLQKDTLIELGISELIVRMLQQQAKDFLLNQIQTNPEQTGLHKAIHYLEQHIDEPLNMDHLQKLACMSRSKFFHQFKLNIGCSPQEFQIQKRMEAAAKRLKQGMSVTQACLDSGFKNMSHFSRRFQQYFGLSPTQFKRSA